MYEHGKKIDVDRKKISLAFEDGGTKATAVLEEPYKVRPKGEKRDIEVCHEKKKTFQDLYDCLELDVAREVNAVARFNRLTSILLSWYFPGTILTYSQRESTKNIQSDPTHELLGTKARPMERGH